MTLNESADNLLNMLDLLRALQCQTAVFTLVTANERAAGCLTVVAVNRTETLACIYMETCLQSPVRSEIPAVPRSQSELPVNS